MHFVSLLEVVVLQDEEGGKSSDVEVVDHALCQIAEVAQLRHPKCTSNRKK